MDNIAVAANATAAPMQLPDVGSGTSILVSLGYFCLILAVIYLAYYLMKRFGVSGMAMGGKSAPRLIGRLMLGSRQSLAVVRFRGKDFLLGVTDERINTLGEFEADENVEEGSRPSSFAALLKRSADNEE